MLLLAAGYADGDLVLTLCIAWEVGLLRTGSDVWSAVRISPAQAASGGQHCNPSLTYLLYAIGSDMNPVNTHGAAVCALQLPAVLLAGHEAARQCRICVARAGSIIVTHTVHGPQVVNIPPKTQHDDVVILTSLGAPLPNRARLTHGDHKVQQQLVSCLHISVLPCAKLRSSMAPESAPHPVLLQVVLEVSSVQGETDDSL